MSSFANEVDHARCLSSSCVEYDVEKVQIILGTSNSTASKLTTKGKMASKAAVVKREKKQYILLSQSL